MRYGYKRLYGPPESFGRYYYITDDQAAPGEGIADVFGGDIHESRERAQRIASALNDAAQSDLERYERRVQAYEDQGLTRSDAQGVVDGGDMIAKRPDANRTAETRLKACPFCGAVPHVSKSGDGTGVMIECGNENCGVRPHTSWYGAGVAHAAWNQRVSR